MLELLIFSLVLALLLLATNVGWSWSNWKVGCNLQGMVQTVTALSRINDEINARVQNRIRIINEPSPMGRALRKAETVNAGADVVAMEQPANVQMTGIIDEARELERELRRPRNDTIGWTVRDDFGGDEEEA